MTATVHPIRPARDAAPSLQPLVNLVAGDLNEVNRVILDRMQSPVSLIPALAGHLIADTLGTAIHFCHFFLPRPPPLTAGSQAANARPR